MAILWCGGEDVDLPNNFTGFGQSTGAPYCRTGYGRLGITPISNSSQVATSNPFPGGAVTSAWVSAQVRNSGATRIFGLGRSTGANGAGFYVGNSAVISNKLTLFL